MSRQVELKNMMPPGFVTPGGRMSVSRKKWECHAQTRLMSIQQITEQVDRMYLLQLLFCCEGSLFYKNYNQSFNFCGTRTQEKRSKTSGCDHVHGLDWWIIFKEAVLGESEILKDSTDIDNLWFNTKAHTAQITVRSSCAVTWWFITVG